MTTALPDLNELAAKVGEAARAAEADSGRSEALVDALLEFAEALLEQREFTDAASASAEATGLLGTLIEAGDNSLRVKLAAALRHHADALIELDQGELALEVYANAVRVLADLAQDDPAVQPEFTRALLNYGEGLRRCDRLEQALRVLDDALALFESFSFGEGGDPTQVPLIALAQLNRGKTLAALGRSEEALAATREAVAVFHEYRDGLPQLYAVSYADALDALAAILHALGRVEEAVEPAEKGLEVIASLARTDAIRYLYPLARLANNLGRAYQQIGQFERAAPMLEQSVGGFRILANAQPHAYRTALARVMANYGLALAQSNQLERAYAIAKEAVELAEAEDLLPLLTGGKQFLADLCADLDRPEEAVEQLVEGMRRLKEAVAEGVAGASEAAERLGRSTRETSERFGVRLPEDVDAMLAELGD